MTKELLPPCRYCKYMESMEQIKCADNCNSLKEFNDYVKCAIAARDKNWIAWAEKAMCGCRTLTCKYMTPDCEVLNNACMAWQERKKEIGI